MSEVKARKRELRAQMRQLRADMPPHERSAADAAILERICGHPLYQSAKTVLAYVSMPHEVATRDFLARCLSNGKTLGLPICDADTHTMTFYRLDSISELTAGAYGIPVPPQEQSRVLTPDAETVVLVPMLAFDSDGYRLGAGGGYYDRFLAQYPGLPAVGICYAQCKVGALPRDRYDRRLTHCITQHNTEEYNGKA